MTGGTEFERLFANRFKCAYFPIAKTSYGTSKKNLLLYAKLSHVPASHSQKTDLLSVNLTDWEAVGDTGAVVQVPRVDKQEIDALFVGHLLHVGDKGRKIAKVARVIRLWQ